MTQIGPDGRKWSWAVREEGSSGKSRGGEYNQNILYEIIKELIMFFKETGAAMP